jgi:hypothetical protein
LFRLLLVAASEKALDITGKNPKAPGHVASIYLSLLHSFLGFAPYMAKIKFLKNATFRLLNFFHRQVNRSGIPTPLGSVNKSYIDQ